MIVPWCGVPLIDSGEAASHLNQKCIDYMQPSRHHRAARANCRMWVISEANACVGSLGVMAPSAAQHGDRRVDHVPYSYHQVAFDAKPNPGKGKHVFWWEAALCRAHPYWIILFSV